MSDADCTILDCPDCRSHRAGIIASSPPQARCSDCGKVYAIATLSVADEPSPGTITLHTEGIIKGGADELVRAHKEAARLSAKFGEEIEAQWCLMTPWLSQLSLTNRARARYAMTWRPRFLATLALSRSQSMASRAAKVSHVTARRHRREDSDFEVQCIAAEEHAVELLHDVTFKSALEGECEPVLWQGIQVGHIIRHDNRLRIEMLRANMPQTFKTPGLKGTTINLPGAGGALVVIGEAERDELVAMRQSALNRIAAKRAQATLVERTPV
jgi:hypothetical protein